jgi:hypothetical protein
MRIPAICDNCKTVFNSGIVVDGNSSITTGANMKSGPCPNCGGQGTILAAMYQGAGEFMQIFLDPTVSRDQLKILTNILEHAASVGASPREIAKDIAKYAPAFGVVNDWLQKYSPIINTIGVLATVAGLVLSAVALHETPAPAAVSPPTLSPDQIGEIFERAVHDELLKQQALHAHAKRRPKVVHGPRPAQNAVCPCGSGKKFKLCHGDKRFPK